MRDRDLLRRVVAGSPGAFEELFLKYVDRVYRHIATIVGPHADAEDLTQAVFIRVHRSLPKYRFDCSFATWIHRISVNVALNHLRDSRKHRNCEVYEEGAGSEDCRGPAPSAVDVVETRQELALMYRFLEKLSDRKRVVFVMYEIEGYTLEEIAQILNCPVNTVASRLRNARVDVRKAMHRHLASAAKQTGGRPHEAQGDEGSVVR